MTSFHTPGPWVADLHNEQRDGGRFRCFVLARGIMVPIAAVPTGVEGYGREEGRANASLIAAAPELLKALETLVERAENFNVSGVYFDEPCMVEERAALEAAHDAIEKARSGAA